MPMPFKSVGSRALSFKSIYTCHNNPWRLQRSPPSLSSLSQIHPRGSTSTSTKGRSISTSTGSLVIHFPTPTPPHTITVSLRVDGDASRVEPVSAILSPLLGSADTSTKESRTTAPSRTKSTTGKSSTTVKTSTTTTTSTTVKACGAVKTSTTVKTSTSTTVKSMASTTRPHIGSTPTAAPSDLQGLTVGPAPFPAHLVPTSPSGPPSSICSVRFQGVYPFTSAHGEWEWVRVCECPVSGGGSGGEMGSAGGPCPVKGATKDGLSTKGLTKATLKKGTSRK